MARSVLYPPSVKPGILKLGNKPKGWIEKTFGEVLQVVQRPAEIADDDEYQLVTAKRSRGGIVPREVLLGKNILTKVQYYVAKDDFLISKRQIVHGACGVVPSSLDGAIVSGEYSVLRVNNRILLKYLDYFSHTDYFQMSCFQSSVGVDVEKMIFDLKGWLKLQFYLPPMPEQKEIVNILSAWDNSISLTEQLIVFKQKRKKGLAEKLLNALKRFPGFNDDWKKCSLGEIAVLTAGGTPSTSKDDFWNGSIRWMNSGEINLRYVWEVEGRITEAGLNNSSTKIIPVNSVLIALAGQGKTRGMVAINKVETTTNQSIAAIIPDNTKLNYLYLFFNLDNRYEELRLLSGGNNGRGGLNLTHLKNLEIFLPPLQEQVKISQTLETCDKEIDLLGRRLEALKHQRKGLMQKLLTGQIRIRHSSME